MKDAAEKDSKASEASDVDDNHFDQQFGPFTTEQMQEWNEGGYFDKVVLLRRRSKIDDNLVLVDDMIRSLDWKQSNEIDFSKL